MTVLIPGFLTLDGAERGDAKSSQLVPCNQHALHEAKAPSLVPQHMLNRSQGEAVLEPACLA